MGEIVPGGPVDLFDSVGLVRATIINNGTVPGAEVAQLYIGLPQSAPPTPPKQLRGFSKINLDPGDSGTVEFTLTRRDLSYWDVSSQQWVVPSGVFTLYVGSSSRDIRLTNTITLPSLINASSVIHAADYTSNNGTQTQQTLDIGGGENVGWIHDGEWLAYSGIEFGNAGYTSWISRVSSGASNSVTGSVHLVLDNVEAIPVANFTISNTRGWQNWINVTTPIETVSGLHTVYLTFSSNQSADFVNVNWFAFS